MSCIPFRGSARVREKEKVKVKGTSREEEDESEAPIKVYGGSSSARLIIRLGCRRRCSWMESARLDSQLWERQNHARIRRCLQPVRWTCCVQSKAPVAEAEAAAAAAAALEPQKPQPRANKECSIRETSCRYAQLRANWMRVCATVFHCCRCCSCCCCCCCRRDKPQAVA